MFNYDGNFDMNDGITKFFTLMFFSIGLQLLLAWPLMVMWNDALVPAVTGVHEIGWLQAWFLQVLVSLLFRTGIESKV